MNFSICLASRERPQLLTNLVQSIQNTTFDLENVEIVVGIDDDDQISQDKCRELKEQFSFFKFFSRERSKNLNRDYINAAYNEHSNKGNFLIGINDDCVFKTKDWDKIGIETLNSYLSNKPDRICYAFVSDSLINRHNMQYSCFPVISKESIQVLGWGLVQEYQSWNSDIATWRIYHNLGRICDLSQILIHHDSYHSGTRERDHISHHVERINNGAVHVPIPEYTRILSQAIRNYKGN